MIGREFIVGFGVLAFAGTWFISAALGGIAQLYWQAYQNRTADTYQQISDMAGDKMERDEETPLRTNGSVGASSALFGLFFSYICFSPRDSIRINFLWRPAWQWGVFCVGGSIYCMVAGALPIIGHAGHLGGMAGGVLSYFALVRPLMYRAARRQMKAVSKRRKRKR